MVFDILKKRRTEKLWEEATSLLAKGSYAEVLDIAKRLENERYSGAFDLAAQAYAGLGKLEDAISVLERGVAVAPEAWLNWELLGNYRSDAGRHDEASAAYGRALECEGVWVDSIRFNQAILEDRRGLHRRALETLGSVQAPEFRIRKLALEAHLLLETNDPSGAMALFRNLEPPEDPTADERYWLADTCLTYARALAATGKPSEAVYDIVRGSIEAYPESRALLSYLRELQPRPSDGAKLFGVTVSYELDPAERMERGAVGFVRFGQVLADTREEALAMMRELEKFSLLLLGDEPEIEFIEDKPGSLKGVVVLSPRHYYESRD